MTGTRRSPLAEGEPCVYPKGASDVGLKGGAASRVAAVHDWDPEVTFGQKLSDMPRHRGALGWCLWNYAWNRGVVHDWDLEVTFGQKVSNILRLR
jgi:hypothetical protein